MSGVFEKLRRNRRNIHQLRLIKMNTRSILSVMSTWRGLPQLKPAPDRSYRERASTIGRRLSITGITTSTKRTMREEGTSKQVGCVVKTHRDAERCVIASSTHPNKLPATGSRSVLLTSKIFEA